MMDALEKRIAEGREIEAAIGSRRVALLAEQLMCACRSEVDDAGKYRWSIIDGSTLMRMTVRWANEYVAAEGAAVNATERT